MRRVGSSRGFLVVTATYVMAVSTLMQYSLSAIGPYIIGDLELSSAVFGSFFTLYFAICAAGSLAIGGPSQRLGPQWGMAMVGIAAGVGLLAIATAPGLAVVYVGLFLSGIAGALCNPATNLTLMNVPSRGTAIGVKQSGVQVSAVFGGFLVAPLAQWLGWRGALVICAALAFALVFPALRSKPGDGAQTANAADAQQTTSILGLAVFAFLMGSGLATSIAYLPVYAHDDLEFSTRTSGLLVGIFGLCAVIGRVAWGYISERSAWFARSRVALGTMAIGALLATTALWLAGFDLPYLVFPGAVVMGLTGAGWNGLVMTFVINSSSAASSGRAAGRVQAAFFGGLCVTPLLFGHIVDQTGSFVYAWIGTAAIYVVAAVTSQTLIGVRKRTRPELASSRRS